MKRYFWICWLGALSVVNLLGQGGLSTQSGYVSAEFIADNPPHASSHASTIIDTRDGLIAAWFGGTQERALDVSIFISHRDTAGWSAPAEVADGVASQEYRRYPCWNPVLFQPRKGPLYLFYKVGPSPSEWWGMVKASDDGGKTWGKPKQLPGNYVGPVRNKPVELDDGTILCGSSTEFAGWQVRMEWAKDPMRGWDKSPALNSAMEFGAIQPTVLLHGPDTWQILCRTRQEAIVESWSTNRGLTWSPLKKTGLPNPNSAIDAVGLKDGRFLLVYNHTTEGRSPLNIAISPDGKKWFMGLSLEEEPGEFSYPAVIQSGDGLVHVTYTWNRKKIKHVVVDPAKLDARRLINTD